MEASDVEEPVVGQVYVDAQGRQLTVEVVDGENHLGRNVLGTIISPYSTDSRTFATTWRKP